MSESVHWAVKSFDELTVSELYELLRIRSAVFVVEQACVYLDLDNRDQHALHVMGYQDGKMVAVARIFPPDTVGEMASFGRVACVAEARGHGLGKQLVQYCLTEVARRFPNAPVKIGAQVYLEKMYGSYGFIPVGSPYDEDGIPHVDMVRQSAVL